MDPSAVIETESRRFAEVLAATPPDARCPTCPEWTAADLLWHLTKVQWFWSEVLARGARTEADVDLIDQAEPTRPTTVQEMLPYRERATAALLTELARLDDAEPRWSWWATDQTVGFTRRMQVYEATMHRVDAELAAGRTPGPIDTDVAAGAVDQCVDVMWGWLPDWADYQPVAVVELSATDVDRAWLVELGHWTGIGPESGKEFDEPRAVRAAEGTVPAATVSAPVQDLALWAWTRGGSVAVDGTADARAALDRVVAHGIP